MTEDDHGLSQAKAQFQSIAGMVKAWRKACLRHSVTDTNAAMLAVEAAEQTIHEDALSIEVRTGWYVPSGEPAAPEEFCILLCTGGPAVRIRGRLSVHLEPETAVIEYQDWGTPWTAWNTSLREGPQAILLDYCRRFYFGEG